MLLPVYFLKSRGSFTVPISSHWRWWVHPSLIRIVSPSQSESIAFAPFAAVSSTPLYLAIRIEKEVSLMSFGVSFAIAAKAWLSVITSDGFWASEFKVCSNSLSLVTTAIAPESRISRITICCGKIILPFGAALSIGTSTTVSPALIKSEQSVLCSLSDFNRLAILSFNSKTPVFCSALTSIPSSVCGGFFSKSALL